MNYHKVKCSNFEIANNKPFTLIAGPCQLESEEHALKISTELKKITNELGINLIYKTSFDKANRTSLKGKRGMGLEKSLPIFDKIRTFYFMIIHFLVLIFAAFINDENKGCGDKGLDLNSG